MGQKVNPIGFRVGIVRDWESTWYADKDYQTFLHEDLAIRKYLKAKLFHAGISKVRIERAASKAKVYVHAAKPGIIIGKRASGLEALRDDLKKLVTTEVFLNVIEVRKVETDAQLVAENIAAQLVKRVSFRRAMKKAVASALRMGADGIKVICSGRLGGSEMSRREMNDPAGRVPLHTLRADIDFARSTGFTTSGTVGVKVWICHGEVVPEKEQNLAN